MVIDGGAGLRLLVETITATVQRAADRDPETAAHAVDVEVALGRLVEVTERLWKDGDAAVALANATLYLEAAGHLVVAWTWLEQLLVVGERTGAFFEGKRAAARYFFRFELPTINPKLDLLASLDRTTLDVDPAVL